ncbi:MULTISPECIES: transporter [unclassified Lysobacter]|uniref:SphA family protein n=1 Tax=unclassified Lysobacter TaxID=2635362 RepID=UPI001BE65249|nr:MULTISPECIES: transporter [unclassified Lysobacter]MBT2748864.1 transporter [Lysobacter sp. ISL-42]MBT2751089.1 transporter [Lysobacter sp. ISL-50]MBT2779635.1 transporter [Lysobacter sp. ISL-54]MBT2783405.1 transporter [Lysobacter sp. ISL-52]
MCNRFGASVLALALALPAPAFALDLPAPPVNLGSTSFEDGGGGKGLMFQWSMSHFRASDSYDAAGRRRPGAFNRDLWVARPHLAYAWDMPVLGGLPGVEVIQPIASIDIKTATLDESQTRLGNTFVGPFVQWSGKKLFGRPFSSRLTLGFNLPLGAYDRNAALNLGNHYWSFNPYYAFTWRATDKLETSGRLMYLWNGRNNDPETAVQARFGAPLRHTQVGQAWHMNLSVSYQIAPQWRLGVGGYVFNQIDPDRINGIRQPGSKEHLFGVGPGVQWRGDKDRLIANYYFESHARNRAEGEQLVLRWMHVF